MCKKKFQVEETLEMLGRNYFLAEVNSIPSDSS